MHTDQTADKISPPEREIQLVVHTMADGQKNTHTDYSMKDGFCQLGLPKKCKSGEKSRK